MRESALVTYDGKLIAAVAGHPAHVDFPFEQIWSYYKQQISPNPDLLRFYHVHPKGFGIEPSNTDLNCMEGFTAAFGYPVSFFILRFLSEDPALHEMAKYFWSDGLHGSEIDQLDLLDGLQSHVLFELSEA